MELTQEQQKFKEDLLAQDKELIADEYIKLAQEYGSIRRDFNHLAVVCYQTLSKIGVMTPSGEIKGDMSSIIGTVSTLATKSMLSKDYMSNQFAFIGSLSEVWERRNEEIMAAVKAYNEYQANVNKEVKELKK